MPRSECCRADLLAIRSTSLFPGEFLTVPRIFVSEFLTCGAMEDELPTSLLTEGRNMLLAVVEDFAAIPQCSIATTWDRRFGEFPVPNVDVISIGSAAEEAAAFLRLAASSDGTLVVAPETDGILLERLRRLDACGGTSLGANRLTVEVASDKLESFKVLSRHGVRTPETHTWHAKADAPLSFPFVIKPRDGAGTENTFVVRDSVVYEWVRKKLDALEGFVAQPWYDGQSCSVAAVGSEEEPEWLPVVLHRIDESSSGLLHFRGGEIASPAASSRARKLSGVVEEDPLRIPKGQTNKQAQPVDSGSRIAQTCRAAAQAMGWTGGYIGFDCVLPSDGSEPVVVEVNPRLTTSYIGYRALTKDNLALRMLPTKASPGFSRARALKRPQELTSVMRVPAWKTGNGSSGGCQPVLWCSGVVAYEVDGGVEISPGPHRQKCDSGESPSESSVL